VWQYDIKMDFREIEWGGMDWINMDQDTTVAGSCEYGNENSGYIKRWEILMRLVASQEGLGSMELG
jgi:hypothetical protein